VAERQKPPRFPLFLLRRWYVIEDFVEHLRTVHFALALVAVSVGLILILSRTNSPALNQIRDIVKLKKEWSPGWILPSRPEAAIAEAGGRNLCSGRLLPCGVGSAGVGEWNYNV